MNSQVSGSPRAFGFLIRPNIANVGKAQTPSTEI